MRRKDRKRFLQKMWTPHLHEVPLPSRAMQVMRKDFGKNPVKLPSKLKLRQRKSYQRKIKYARAHVLT